MAPAPRIECAQYVGGRHPARRDAPTNDEYGQASVHSRSTGRNPRCQWTPIVSGRNKKYYDLAAKYPVCPAASLLESLPGRIRRALEEGCLGPPEDTGASPLRAR